MSAIPLQIQQQRRVTIEYSADIEAEIACLGDAIRTHPQLAATYGPRWLAIQLLEGDESLRGKIDRVPDVEPLLATLAASRRR